MSNFVFYDFETTSSNKQWGQIIEVGAILADDQLNELDRFDARCRLSPGIIPEAMSLIVSNTTPKKLKETNLSHYEMVKQFVGKLKSWGKVTYIGWNNIEFDQIFLEKYTVSKIYNIHLLQQQTVIKRAIYLILQELQIFIIQIL